MGKYDRFVKKVFGDLDIKIRTPHTTFLNKISKLDENSKEFIVLSLEQLYNEFFITYTTTERK